MTVKRHIVLVIIAAVVFSCGKQEEQPLGDLIRFDTKLVSESISRGVPITQSNATSMGVYSYFTGTQEWTAVAATAESNWMDNQPIRRNVGGTSWFAPTQMYWPEYTSTTPNKLTFFAYAPFAQQGDGITLPQNPNPGAVSSAVGIPELRLQILEDVGNHTDLLLADPVYNQTSQTNGGIVGLSFHHVLSKIGFTAYCLTPATTIQSITLTHLHYQGTIKIDGKKQWTLETDVRDMVVQLSGTPLSTDPSKPTKLSDPGSYCFLFPADFSASGETSQIVVHYTEKGKSVIKSVAITEKWIMGKSIEYKLNLGGSATEDLIIDEVTISPWTLTGTEDMETE